MAKKQTKAFNKIAIIANIVDSKSIKERNDFQIKLKILLESINERFFSDIAAKFRITLGDEFQGLLHNPKHVLLIMDDINLSLYPLKVRWGLGVGEIPTTSSILDHRELDGPSYWNARKALDHIKKYNYYGNSLTHLKTSDEDIKFDTLINSFLQLQDTIRLSWTYDQSFIIQYLLKEHAYDSFVQKDVAKTLGLSQQRISNVLAATSFKQYAKSRDLCTHYLISEIEYI